MSRGTAVRVLVVLGAVALFTSVLPQSAVVALVNGTPVTLDDWNREANITKLLVELKNVNELFYDVFINSVEGQKILDVYKRRVLDTYVRKLLFIQFAESLRVAPRPEDVRKEVDNEISKMLTEMKMTTEQLNKYLLELGMGTLEDYKQRLYFQRMYVLSLTNVFALYSVPTEHEIRAYYEQNRAKYAVPTTYDMIVMRVKDTATAERIRQEILTGTSAKDIAQKYNVTNFIEGNIVDGDTSFIPQPVWSYVRNATRGVPMNVPSGSERIVFLVRSVQLGRTKTLEEVRNEIVKELTNQKQAIATETVKIKFDEFIKRSKIEYRI